MSNREDLDQLTKTVLTRADTQAEADALFGRSPEARAQADAELNKMFVQGKVSRRPTTSSTAPDVVKTSAIDAYVEKTAGVYNRYPELLKVATPTPKVVSKPKTTETTGPVPTKSSLSGGAA